MTPLTLSLPLAKVHTRILVSISALFSLLGLSFVVGLGVAASSPGFIGVFLGAVAGVAAIVGLLSKLMRAKGSSAWFGDAGWGAIQVALVGLANNASKINTDASGALRVAAVLQSLPQSCGCPSHRGAASDCDNCGRSSLSIHLRDRSSRRFRDNRRPADWF